MLTPVRLRSARASLPFADDWLMAQLNALDGFTAHHIRQGHGGPFGAELRLYDQTLDEWLMVSGPSGNAVLAKGLGSAHAEAETLTPAALETILSYRAEHPEHDLHLLQLSTAESCPACRAKQIGFMHRLIARGWPKARPLSVVFGATYEDTANIAGFNDQPYDDEIKGTGPALVSHRAMALLPDGLNLPSDSPFAAIVTGGRVLSLVTREGDVPMEVMAIQWAAQNQKEAGHAQPWRLDHEGPAQLMTTASEVGPLMWTECQWAAVSELVLVGKGSTPTPAESPLVNNADFLMQVQADYNTGGAPILAHQLTDFANQAQQIWRDEILPANPAHLYNGADIEGG